VSGMTTCGSEVYLGEDNSLNGRGAKFLHLRRI